MQCKDVILHKGKKQNMYYIDFCGTTLEIKESNKIEVITSLETTLSGIKHTNPTLQESECLRYFGIETGTHQPGHGQPYGHSEPEYFSAQVHPHNQPFQGYHPSSPTSPEMQRPFYDEYGNIIQ